MPNADGSVLSSSEITDVSNNLSALASSSGSFGWTSSDVDAVANSTGTDLSSQLKRALLRLLLWILKELAGQQS